MTTPQGHQIRVTRDKQAMTPTWRVFVQGRRLEDYADKEVYEEAQVGKVQCIKERYYPLYGVGAGVMTTSPAQSFKTRASAVRALVGGM